MDNDEIIMEGNLFYRYGMDQIELGGAWSLSSENEKCHFSYLLSPRQKLIQIPIDPLELSVKEGDENLKKKCKKYYDQINQKYIMNLCSANIFEVLLIPNLDLLKYILSFLSGDYHGFFVYFGKTIEDNFNLVFNYENNQVRVSGGGKNNLGDFNIFGFVNFFTIKEQLLNNNDPESDVINFGLIKLTRIYNDFNSNENNRVIKSFQHSRKKYDEFV